MKLKLSSTSNIILLCLQIMNQLLKRGFIIFCLLHPVITLICLNALCAMALHESCHLGFSRIFNQTPCGMVTIQKGSLSAYVRMSPSIGKNSIICLSPVVLGIFGVIIHTKTSLNFFITLPWIMNLSSLVPFSQDMKTFSQWMKSL